MSAQTMTMPEAEERMSERVRFDGALSYRYDLNEHGSAAWCSVGRDGVCISLGRYLRPGRHVTLMSLEPEATPVELSGRIVWCRPTADGQHFVAGVRIFDDRGSAAPASALFGAVAS